MSDTINPVGQVRLTVTRDSSTDPEPDTQEYDRFESLARRIVAVPKAEVDEQRENTRR